MTSKPFTVITRDVDGSTRRTYATLAGAVKRFEEMSGWTIANVIADQYDGQVIPTLASLVRIHTVSMFGTVVELTKPVTPELAAPVISNEDQYEAAWEAYYDGQGPRPVAGPYDAVSPADWNDDIPF